MISAGASVEETGTRFRVWAPRAQRVEVVFTRSDLEPVALAAEPNGYFSGVSNHARVGEGYRYRLDGAESFPDPWSRFQPEGPHGPSMVVDPSAYAWHDADWRGLDPSKQIFYELHIGAFTKAGTYAAAAEKLELLRDLGITAIELMPINEFGGTRGWGYDGVDWFAPYHHYGSPDDLRQFVDRAHQLGLGVILDVVYNHLGADGNYLPKFSNEYFTDRHANDWGQTINYYCEPVRRCAIDNAAYWIAEFHFDGLRLDAVQSIHDPDYPRLLADLVAAARAAAGSRRIVICAEDYLQRADLVRPIDAGGAGLDYVWNDDFHHVARVALTGNRGGYFRKYRGTAQELLSALRRGFLFQGQLDAWRGEPRGTPTRHVNPACFIACTQNHDQVANTLNGQRLRTLTTPARARAMAAVLLLGPHTPLVFMGQEFDASTPFTYFADYTGQVAADLWQGRRRELKQFEQYTGENAQAAIPDPSAPETFERAKLHAGEQSGKGPTWQLYRDLISLRRNDPALARSSTLATEGAVLEPRTFVLRWFDDEHGDRLLLVNLGDQLDRTSIAESLLAPPAGRNWRLVWSSDEPRYGGLGVVAPLTDEGWFIAAEASSFFVADS